MSFCRFSSDNFRSDFYAYESAIGYELHVASNRVIWDPPFSPMEPYSLQLPALEWAERYRDYMDRLHEAPREPIVHPAAGEFRVFDSLQELRDRIAELVGEGFHAPEGLLEELDSEISDPMQSDAV